MRQYVVYRHGWNEANQRRADGAPEKMPVLRIDADLYHRRDNQALRRETERGLPRL